MAEAEDYGVNPQGIPSFQDYEAVKKKVKADEHLASANVMITPGLWRFLCSPFPKSLELLVMANARNYEDVVDEEDAAELELKGEQLILMTHFDVDPMLRLDDLDLDDSLVDGYEMDPLITEEEEQDRLEREFAERMVADIDDPGRNLPDLETYLKSNAPALAPLEPWDMRQPKQPAARLPTGRPMAKQTARVPTGRAPAARGPPPPSYAAVPSSNYGRGPTTSAQAAAPKARIPTTSTQKQKAAMASVPSSGYGLKRAPKPADAPAASHAARGATTTRMAPPTTAAPRMAPPTAAAPRRAAPTTRAPTATAPSRAVPTTSSTRGAPSSTITRAPTKGQPKKR